MKPSRLVALYPTHWRKRYGKEFSALLEELPVSPSVVLDVLVAAIGARLSYVRERSTGKIRTHGTGTVARLARVAMLAVLIVTPVATGAVGYYLGRSQVSAVKSSCESAFVCANSFHVFMTFEALCGTSSVRPDGVFYWDTRKPCP